MIPFWSTVPAFTALVCAGCIFAFSGHLRRFQKFIGFTLVFDGLFVLLGAMITEELDTFYAPTYLLYSAMMLTTPFLYYFAVRYLLKESGAGKRDLWMLEIILVFIVLAGAISGSIPAADKNAFQAILNGSAPLSNNVPTGAAVMLAMDDTAFIFFLLEMLFVQIFCFVNLVSYGKKIQDYYSNIRGKSLERMTIIFVLVAARFLIYLGMEFIPSLTTSGLFRAVQTIFFSLFFVVTAVASCRIRFTAEELDQMVAAATRKSEGCNDKVPAGNEVIKARMDKLIEDKFYLNPDVDLIMVSSEIHVNYKYVTDYLKYNYGETFMVFVNRLRIEYAEELLQNKSIGIPDVAEQSGFISESTFYRNFIKTRGMTPSKYRKMH